jgi:hypothetical protein
MGLRFTSGPNLDKEHNKNEADSDFTEEGTFVELDEP